jgi:YegS/Rv2252/BmrU family lipid kinase
VHGFHRHVVAIHNPVAGRRDVARFRIMVRHLELAGFRVSVRGTTEPGAAERIGRDAGRSGCDIIVVAGGDGTVNEVLNGLAGATIPLAIFPLGTTNVLAEELGLPSEPADFVAALMTLAPREAWTASVDGRHFALMASVGFDAEVVAGVNLRLKRAIGKGAYALSALRQWLVRRAHRYTVRIDGRDFQAAMVVVAKGHFYGGRFVAAPGAAITEQLLHVVLIAGSRRRDLLRYLWALARGRLHCLPDVRILTAREVAIAAVMPAPIQVDGDIRASLPAVIRIDEQPLRLYMAAPPPAPPPSPSCPPPQQGLRGLSPPPPGG